MCVTFDRAGPDEILWAHDPELRGIHLMYSYKLMKKKRSGIKSFKPQVRFLAVCMCVCLCVCMYVRVCVFVCVRVCVCV